MWLSRAVCGLCAHAVNQVCPVCLSVCAPSLSGLWPHWVSFSQAKSEWEGAERRSLEGLAQCRKEAQAHLREVQETVDSLPRQVGERPRAHLSSLLPLATDPPPTLVPFQIEAVSDRCILHKSDSDLKISAEGKAR